MVQLLLLLSLIQKMHQYLDLLRKKTSEDLQQMAQLTEYINGTYLHHYQPHSQVLIQEWVNLSQL